MISKVRKFGHGARVVCSALFGFGLVGSAGMLLLSVLGLFFPLPDATGLPPEQRLWGLPLMVVTIGLWLAIVYQLYRLFGNLASGAIYTPENVRRVRHVGLLWLSLIAVGFLVPLAAHALAAMGMTIPLESAFKFPGLESVDSLIGAGVILLASWIMDVGLYQKDHADALQRDADLVI